jgi:hypothetical protein
MTDPKAIAGFKDFVDRVIARPEVLIALTMAGIAAFLAWRRTLTRGKAGALLLAAAVAFFLFSLTDPDFRRIVTKPDNVPIAGMLFLVGFFTWLAVRKMTKNDEAATRGEPTFEAKETKARVFVWPDLVYGELICLVVVTVVLILWSIGLKAPLEEPASPSRTPNPSKAPWYFLGLQELLIYYDPWIAGVVVPGFIIVGLMAIPFLDRNSRGNGYYTFRERPFAVGFFLFGFIVLWIIPIVIGTFLRGPNQALFGPYEYWDPHKVQAIVNVNVSDIFWIRLLGQPLPDKWYVRELPGLLLVLGYLFVLPPILARTIFRKLHAELGMARYSVFIFFFLFTLAVPIKEVCRWTFNLKYVVNITEFFFNI